MLKPILASDSTTCISPSDPAIDKSASGSELEKYKTSKKPDAWKDLKLKTDEKPTIFHIGTLPPGDLSSWRDRCGPESLFWNCFLNGVRKIENWASNEKIPTVTRDAGEFVDPEWLRRTFVRPLRKTAIDVGAFVLMFNSFEEDEAKN